MGLRILRGIRVRLRALEAMGRSLLPPRLTCKFDRDFNDECLDY